MADVPPPPDDDPGWRVQEMLPLAVPFFGALRAKRRFAERDTLFALRGLFVSFVGALVLFGVVIASISGLPHHGAFPGLLIVIGWAVVAGGLSLLTNRPLECSSPRSLADAYRARFFVRIAFAESIALVAFVLTFA